MRRFLTCFLALCCAALLVACEWSAVPLEGDKPPVGSPPEPMEITGQLASYTEGNVDVALTIPDGWWWETLEEDGQSGLRFGKTGERSVAFRLTCWAGRLRHLRHRRDGAGADAVRRPEGVAVHRGGQSTIWVNIAFQGVPGSYVCMPDDNGVMGSAAWDGCRDEVLAILGTAQIGRGILTEQQAIDLAAAQYDGAYAMAWGRYDVKTGCWSVVFSEDSSGGNTVTRNVDSSGTVSDEEPRCWEEAMEDGEK